MNRRDFLKRCVAIGAGGVLLSNQTLEVHIGAGRPNLLVLHTDQQSRWTLGAYGGSEVSTPNIDSLAKQGAVFNNFFTNHATCTASRGCLQTGRYPHAHGAWKNNIEFNRDEITFAQFLRDNGYDTGYSGKWHLDGGPKPGWVKTDRAMGFADSRYMFNRGHWKSIIEQPVGDPEVSSEIGDEKTFTTDWLAGKTIEFIEKPRTKPFCYMVSFPDPHGPRSVRVPYDTMFDPEDMIVPSTLEQEDADKPDWASGNAANGDTPEERSSWIKQQKTQYFGMVKCIDDSVGRILQALKTTGQLDNTICVYTTDHGEFMGEHGLLGKGAPYDTAYHIPFLMRWPQRIPKGTVVNNIVSTVDFMPTILTLMGFEPGGREQGYDASALLMGRNAGWKEESFIHHEPRNLLGIFTPDYELCYVKDRDHVLFDRRSDPDQVNNLFNDPAYKTVVDDLTERIIRHNIEVGDSEVEWLEQI